MKKRPILFVILFTVLLIAGYGGNSISRAALPAIVVNSLEDVENPPEGTVTLRSAIALAAYGQSIVFDASLDGGTIELSIVDEEHTVLKGEIMGIEDQASGPVSYLVGYFNRDYGRSALYARKDVVIDASSLPSGITLAWMGGEENPARVLAVYGDLTMTNVSVTDGWSVAEELPTPDPDDEYGQLSTRARGAGLAVWGVARLVNCTVYNNHCARGMEVPARSRDAGAFGGGIYADIVDLEKCVVSGNSISASGVSGGGVFSVGGADTRGWTSSIEQCAITGNRIRGIFAYGGGCYSDGGGIGKRKTLALTNCTIARNLVEPLPGLPPFMYGIGYWRGGGLYMSNGFMSIHGCTIVENQVHGVPRIDDLGKPNLAGGVAATIGNAHAVETLSIGHSVIAGNTVQEVGGLLYDHDIFTGSLLYFKSMGYNRIGVIDFRQILVPVGEPNWASLCRRHYPKAGDEGGVDVAEVLNLDTGVTLSDSILSAGVGAPNPVVLHYEPQGSALDQIPTSPYSVDETYGEYDSAAGVDDNFLAILLDRVESHFGLADFASEFTIAFEAFLQNVDSDDDTAGIQPYTDPSDNPILTLADTQWFGPSQTWPKELPNYPYIHFWHRLDLALLAEGIPGMGPEVLGDDDWAALFTSGTLVENPGITMDVWIRPTPGFAMLEYDQLGTGRPANTLGDIGALEYVSPSLGSLSGQVIDRDTGLPIERARVSLRNFWSLAYRTLSFDRGYYGVYNIQDGRYVLRVTKRGYRAYWTTVTIDANVAHDVRLIKMQAAPEE
jgi:hypothetical protein